MTSHVYRGFEVRSDRFYHHDTNLWALPVGDDIVRVGLDALGLEVNGTLAQLTLVEPPCRVVEGDPIGSLEAEKYVGALAAPLAGTILRTNDHLVRDVTQLYAGCYEAWLVEMATEPGALDHLVTPDEALEDFTKRVEAFRAAGVLAW
ncbi:glycine cleavage H-protein [Acidimicrobium ferrooxidans DSM 10331]|uniref:Glycine cleavage H-protein n=1 Tax=Acidimicrobium ferrooxidans (strain DSM 10331 / JCM 15462 / NBRC 103882 / ICP) TaxID=525909 RepID=C7LZ32_ACIFD|nr:glycine cleavage protein H [Acidimicrobium ferrooxidans]ACU53990.1 glycine cleavage H-protein [Acidimicrobium ferrooxidans DSM 10331]